MRNLAFVSALYLLLSPLASAETWRFTSLDWKPYSCRNLPGGGSGIYILRQILASIDVNLEIEYLPWKRAQRHARTHPQDYTGYYPAWPTEVAAGFIGAEDPSELVSVFSSPIGVVSKGGRYSWQQITANPDQHKLCLVGSYIYPPEVMEYADISRQTDMSAKDDIEVMRKLLAGRCDAAVVDKYVMQHIIDTGMHLNRSLRRRETGEPLGIHPVMIGNIPLVPSFTDSADNRDNSKRLAQAVATTDIDSLFSQYQQCLQSPRPDECLRGE